MKLRYSGNIMPFEDGMKKVSAVTWAPSGKKLAVGAADRVLISSCSLFTSSMKTDRRKINSRLSLQIRGKSLTLFVALSFLLIPKRSQLPKAITSSSSIRSDWNGDKRKLSATSSLSLPQSLV